ncbi:sensor domain-containing diguanylate cyclase [Hydrogenovibrio halophilus]|uniref:sensor domain-containing diguanylate cyclase n=1 Tax=Hydrogenovibrio halophilus TaxID=373391 RepID=UPI00037FBBE5|nr:diguanylate cyclase [Hydrogenovibrio halophilus]
MSLANAHQTLDSSRHEILSNWVESEPLGLILNTLGIEKSHYQTQVAEPVFDYLSEMLLTQTKKPDCPAMRKLVETFLDSDMHAEDVFLNCTTLKNIIIHTLYSQHVVHKEVQTVATIMDQNLYEMIKLYSHQKMLQDKRFHFHAKLIEEHLALSKTDPEGIITYVTDAYCDLSGYRPDELIGKTHAILRHEEMTDAFFAQMWQQLNEAHQWNGIIKNRTKYGGEFIAKTEILPYYDEDGALIEFIAIRHDITDQMLSHKDPLTSLDNRRFLKDKLHRILQENPDTALIMIDIDHFKDLNDTYGHLFGDEVLKALAHLLRQVTHQEDMCVRWGGEEFMIVLPQRSLPQAARIAESIRTRTAELCLDKNGKEIEVHCSLGVTAYQQQEPIDALIERVDNNLYQAKNKGRNCVVAF